MATNRAKPQNSADSTVPRDTPRLAGAYEDLKARILGGDYLPNQRLIESELTALLGVSRATIRSVLARLQSEGLVDVEAQRGARVRAVTREGAIELLDMREMLEGLAASRAARNGTAMQFEELRSILHAMQKALLTDDFPAHAACNARFHRVIIGAARHEALKTTLASFQFPLSRYRFHIALIPGRKERSLAEHQRIYDCMVQRDAAAAERAMRKHIAEVRRNVAKAGTFASLA